MNTLEQILAEYSLATEHGFEVKLIEVNSSLVEAIKKEIFLFITGVKFQIKTTGELFLWDVPVSVNDEVKNFRLEVQPKSQQT